MDEARVYEIRIEGQLTERWADWFDSLTLRSEPGGETTLSGPLADQAALLGVLNKIHALNLTLISVHRLSPGPLSRPA
jgi:hypothetical protein